MRAAEVFNRSRLSRFLNQPAGRLFRFTAGLGFLTYGLTHLHQRSGWLALAWAPFPLTAGAFDVCYLSVALGGPFKGSGVRAFQQTTAERIANFSVPAAGLPSTQTPFADSPQRSY